MTKRTARNLGAIRDWVQTFRAFERVTDRSWCGRIGSGECIGFCMLSIKPANDTEEFYRATAKFNQGGE